MAVMSTVAARLATILAAVGPPVAVAGLWLDVVDTFREIAAGVTLLERRATGQAVPTETIMLAVT